MRVIDLPGEPGGHAAPITAVTWRPDGRRLATCSYDGTARIWDTTDPARPVPVATLRHRRLVNGAAWHPTDPDVIATASADKTAVIWRLGTGPVTVLARHTDDVNAVAWLPDGTRLVCVSEDGRATLWDTGTGVFRTEIGGHTAHCMMVSVSADGRIATVGEDGLVVVTDPDSGAPPVTRRYAASVEGCAWSPDGSLLAVARDDGFVELLGPELATVLSVRACGSAARTVAWAEDGARFVAGGYDGALHVFSNTGARLATIREDRVWPRSVSAAHGRLAAGSFGGTPYLFDLDSGAPLSSSDTRTHGPNALASAGGHLFVGGDSGVLLAVDLDDPSRARAVGLTDSPIMSLAAGDGLVFAGTYSGEVLSWPPSGAAPARLGAPVPSLALTGEGLIAGTYDGHLVALDPATLTERGRGESHGGSVKSLAAVPGGFLSAATDRSVAVGSLSRRRTLWEHGNLVNAVAFAPNGMVASASRDHTVKVGRVTGEQRLTLLGPDESVKCVAILGDDTVLAGSYDFGLYAWTVDWSDPAATLRSGRLLAEFRQGVSCAVAIDESRVAVAGWDGRILIVENTAEGPVIRHDLAVADLLAGAREAVPA